MQPDDRAPHGVVFPFDVLPALSEETLRAVEAAALEANERYLLEFIEEHSFCPFSRGGRAQGQTSRFVHYCSDRDLTPVLERMAVAASDPNQVVIQMIMPMIEVTADAWTRFCLALTAALNAHIDEGSEVFAVAPLHPALTYKTSNPFALIPLLRRAPDPTIQWVRLDGLEALYKGRSGETIVVDAEDILEFLKKPRRPTLFDRIAETNLRMADRLGIARVEQALAEISKTVRRRYAKLLLGEAEGEQGSGRDSDESTAPSLREGGCPGKKGHLAPQDCAAPPEPLQAELIGGSWSLATLQALPHRSPLHVMVDGIDLVLVRIGDQVDVLYGRCPHRLALLSEALVEGTRLVCAHHGWDFDVRTGQSEGVPGESIHRFRSWIAGGRVWIDSAELEQWRVATAQVFHFTELA